MELNGEELNNVDHFKYVRSVIDTDGRVKSGIVSIATNMSTHPAG